MCSVDILRTEKLSGFQYLVQHEGVSNSQYLVTAQAGTEATSGSATLTTYVFFRILEDGLHS